MLQNLFVEMQKASKSNQIHWKKIMASQPNPPPKRIPPDILEFDKALLRETNG